MQRSNYQKLSLLVNSAILNSCSISATGLSNGKAGISLSLFEISRVLQDECVEDFAYNLIKETLLSRNSDFSFENGLSGIGFALSYLINYDLLDCNFDELFINQKLSILNSIKSITPTIDSIRLIHFLDIINKYNDYELNLIEKNIIKKIETNLIHQLNQFDTCFPEIPTLKIVDYIKNYLFILSEYPNISNSDLVIEKFINIYKRKRISNNIIIGCHLLSIGKRIQDQRIIDIAELNIYYGNKDLCTSTINLNTRLNYLYWMSQFKHHFKNSIDLLENGIFNSTVDGFEKQILKGLCSKDNISGIYNGLSKLLLYLAYKETFVQNNPANRFNILFDI